MPERAGKLGNPRSIAVLRALQLGDMLCAVPALRALRHALPHAHVTLIGLPWAHEFSARFCHYLDDFIEFPGYPGLPERSCDVSAVSSFLTQVQARSFDLVLQMHGNGRIVNPLTGLIGAKQSAGYYLAGDFRPDNKRFIPWEASEHEIARWLRLLESLGVRARDTSLEFPLLEEDIDRYRALAREHGLDRNEYVCLHAGSQLASRRWPPERFAAVGDELFAAGFRVVLTGTACEGELTCRVARAMRAPAIDLAGRTSLGAAAAVIANAEGLICNDTGVSHIAAAVKTRSVVVSCGSDPARWAPLDSSLHRCLFASVPCRPCSYSDCPFDHPCATAIQPAEVASVMRELLRQPNARQPGLRRLAHREQRTARAGSTAHAATQDRRL